ncbi:hypothetical protein CKO51_17535 [Rhodopirellula sp. SM50]|nr:hypothetical protein CKO51_17535 [Rhodopirellula sp. SM50]
MGRKIDLPTVIAADFPVGLWGAIEREAEHGGVPGFAATPSGVEGRIEGVARRCRCADLRLLAVIPPG